MTKDFELTSVSQSGARYRSKIESGAFTEDGVAQDNTSNYVAWGQLYQMMMDNYGTDDGTLQSAIENYLLNVCGVKQEHIDTLREIMLGD